MLAQEWSQTEQAGRSWWRRETSAVVRCAGSLRRSWWLIIRQKNPQRTAVVDTKGGSLRTDCCWWLSESIGAVVDEETPWERIPPIYTNYVRNLNTRPEDHNDLLLFTPLHQAWWGLKAKALVRSSYVSSPRKPNKLALYKPHNYSVCLANHQENQIEMWWNWTAPLWGGGLAAGSHISHYRLSII